MIGSLVTVIASAVILFTDYRAGIRQYDDAIQQIRQSYISSITYSLWNFDKRQLETQLQGILNFPGITYVQLEHDNKILNTVGDFYIKPDQRLVIPLIYDNAVMQHELGVLRIQQSYRALYDDLLMRAIEIFLSQLLLVFTIAVMLMLIVHRLITQRLSQMARWARHFSLENPELELLIDKPYDQPDELSRVAAAINRMRLTLISGLQQHEKEHQKLQELQEQLTLAIDNAALGFCQYDPIQEHFQCNSHLAAQLGVDEHTIEHMQQPMEFLLSRITGPDADAQTARIRQLLKGHHVRLHDSIRLLDQKQEQRFFDISLQVTAYLNNRPQRVLICSIDRTRELRAREQLAILKLHHEQESEQKIQTLYQECEQLKKDRTRLEHQLERMNLTRQPGHLHQLMVLLAEDVSHWQTLIPQGAASLWLEFLSLDMYGNRNSLDVSQHIQQWLQTQEQRFDFTLEAHLPFSLIVNENPQILTFILNSLLLRNSDPHGAENALTLSVKLTDSTLDARLLLQGDGWQNHANSHEFRICKALVGLRYSGTLNWQDNGEQQELLLSMPFIQ